MREKQMTTGMGRKVPVRKPRGKGFPIFNARWAELSWKLFYVILRASKSMDGVEEADESGLCHEENA
ncbi:MAG TPA: hypothetical protein VK517_06075 [Cyclobacteriaceae bacterium]|nr:hypothetical protein [Cyclobacteriaceae bacterium]